MECYKTTTENSVGILKILANEYKEDWEAVLNVLDTCSKSMERSYIRKVAIWMAFHNLINLKQFSELKSKCVQKKEPGS